MKYDKTWKEFLIVPWKLSCWSFRLLTARDRRNSQIDKTRDIKS